MELRDATEADLPAIVAMLADDMLGRERETLPGPDGAVDTTYLTAFRHMQAQGGNRLLIAEVEGEIAGFLQLMLLPGLSRRGMTRAQIEGVRVSSAFRGQGIGEKMIRAALDVARAEGCALAQLTTDARRADARRFYERLGFEASHVGMKIEL